MPSKKSIQAQKDFAFNMSLLMNIMKSIALAQFVSFKKNRSGRFMPFVEGFPGFFHMMDHIKSKHPLITPASPVTGIILVTSDATMMSGLNSRIIRAAYDEIGEEPAQYIVFGAKGTGRLKMDEKPYKTFPTLTFSNLFSSAVMAKQYIMQQIKEKKLGRIFCIYAQFLSMAAQKPTRLDLVPMHYTYPESLNADMDTKEKIEVESPVGDLAEYLTDLWLTYRLYYAFQDNKLSEVAFQAGQLEGGIQNLEDMKRRLKLSYVKVKREATDSGLREIVSAMIAVIQK